MLLVGKVILLLTTGEPVVWDSVQVLGLLSWILGTILALQVVGLLPTISLG